MRDIKNSKFRKNLKKASKGGESQPVEVNDKFAHIQPVQAQPLEVIVYGNNFDKAMRFFRSKVQKERILSLYKEKQSYEKPSDKRRRKRNEMKRKLFEIENDDFSNHEKKRTFKVKDSSSE